jgi:GxxExxY protein
MCMSENDVAKKVLDAAFIVHTKLGPGLLESVYEVVLAHELRKIGVKVERQKPMPITYDGLLFEEGYRADLLVASKVIVELKSVGCLSSVHSKQVLTQLRLSGLKLGLLVNFGEMRLKNGIKRIINGDLVEEKADISL